MLNAPQQQSPMQVTLDMPAAKAEELDHIGIAENVHYAGMG